MIKESYLLGIDLGTTNIKGNLMDSDGELIATASRPNTRVEPGHNMVEQDANEWWANAVAILKEITSVAGAEIVSKVKGISISSQVPTLLPVDSEGTPLRNAIIYQDTRADRETAEIIERIGFSRYVSIVGGQPSVTFLPGKLLWFKRNEPERFARTAHLLQANAYLNFKLTGSVEIDIDSASRTHFLDINTMDWSNEIAEILDVNLNALLPKPKKCTEIIGTVTKEAAAETGLAEGIPVVAGASDAMASMYATGMSRLGDAGESSGTSSLVFVGSSHMTTPDVPIVTRPCDIDGMPYIFDGPIGASGASIRWYLDTFGAEDKITAESLNISVYDYLNEISLEVSPGSDGVLFFPYLVGGERAPLWNAHAKGMFIGLNISTTRNKIVRSIFEGTAFALRHVIETTKESGGTINSIRVTGGGAKSRTWNMIKASMLHVPVYVMDDISGDVPFGDVLLAGNAVGVFPDLSKAVESMVKVKEIIQPNPEWEAVYDKLYPYYVEMYQKLDMTLKDYKETVDSIVNR